MKKLALLFGLLVLNGCMTYDTPMDRAKGNPAEVYIEDEFKSLSAPEASNLANQHCAQHGKIAQYKGWINGLPQMWHFKCIKE